jgi:hypothetical protein
MTMADDYNHGVVDGEMYEGGAMGVRMDGKTVLWWRDEQRMAALCGQWEKAEKRLRNRFGYSEKADKVVALVKQRMGRFYLDNVLWHGGI